MLPLLQPEAVMSSATKLEVDSPASKVRTIAAVLVEAPLETVLEEIDIAGLFASTTTEPRSPPVIVVPKLLSAASWIVPPLAAIEDTSRAAESV